MLTTVAVMLALLAAALDAVASVAQQRVAFTVPQAQARGVRLLVWLVRSPPWLAGVAGNAGGYVVHAGALAVGSLVLVQPLLATTLLFALPLGARWAGRRLRAGDGFWALLLAASLGVFILVAEPTRGVARASPQQWLPAALVIVTALAGCVLGAAARRGSNRAVLLALAAGMCYGVIAALTKSVVSLVDDGVLTLLASWELYALAISAVGAILLQQSAYQAGDLAASLPAVTVAEPLVAVTLGIVVLQEQVRADGMEWLLIGLLVIVMVSATIALARSAAQFEPSPAAQA
ncbi:MAG: DMT family transporter [Actinobacteria bacterium]|nr:DMT family transporter [Actinomycetota bacterium]